MTPARSARRTPPGAAARRFGLPRTSVGRLVLVVVVALVLDVTAAGAVWVDRRDDPLVPDFERGSLAGVQWDVDTYRDAPGVLGLTPILPASAHRDAQGRIRSDDGPADPDTVIRYALGALETYDTTQDRTWVRSAELALTDLLARSPDGLLAHDRQVTDVRGRTVDPPWYAASTQGLMLSALARLHEATGDPVWQRQADPVFARLRAFRGFFFRDEPAPQHWLTSVDSDGYLWFDRYSTGLDTVGVLREQLTTALGLYDYRRALARTRTRQQATVDLLSGSLATLRHYLPRYRRPQQISVSSLVAGNRNLHDHLVAQVQLRLLGRATGAGFLTDFAARFVRDYEVPFWVEDDFEVVPDRDLYAPLPVDLAALTVPTEPRAVTAGGKPATTGGALDPTRNAMFAVAALERARETGDLRWRRRAEAAVTAALQGSRDGFLSYDYAQDNAFGQPLRRPWHSADGQGLMLSALTRLYADTGDARWRDAADETYRALTTVRDYGYPSPRPWLAFLDFSGYLWFEQLGDGGEPSLLLRGHTDALVGLYDYWSMTGSAEALAYFRGGVTALRDALPAYIRRPGEYARSSLAVEAADPRQHLYLTRQVSALGEVTDDPVLQRQARLLAKDWTRARGAAQCAADVRCARLYGT